MSHARSKIRAAAVTALGGVATTVASRVYPVNGADLPMLLVYTNDEEVSGGTMTSYRRELELVVEAVAQASALDDAIDPLITGIESALNQSTLGGACKPLALTAISITQSSEGAAPVGRARLTFRAIYYTAHAIPETPI